MILTCPVGRDRKNNNGCRSELRTCSIILINFINRIQANKFTSKPLGGTETSSRAMKGDEAKILLGFPPNSTPTSSQVKAAYKKKVWESHPDLFPVHEKGHAESQFKLVSEAYSHLLSGGSVRDFSSGSATTWSRVVVRAGVPKGARGKNELRRLWIPFMFLVGGTIGLAGFIGAR
ncbi:unnamed protein product [Linum tenue]|uniref:J domain-containing protein n=1 Tax=Linum tenue TaxID=586396 RepID=A0AAV0PHM2_9ROSI|nr:unnamed protein product [Linum tenue]